jgi:tetratricopeptide (TPR) repeat protein
VSVALSGTPLFGFPTRYYNVIHRMKPPTLNRQQKAATSVTPAGAPATLSPLTLGMVAVALVATVVAIYSPALDFKFILDDHRYVGDPRIQSPGHLWEYFTTYVWAQFTGGPSSFYRPLFALWMRLNFILSGESAWGWHLLSILKHVSVAVLLGLLVWKLLRDQVAALLAGILFALHPAQTESVAWVSVPDPLMSICILAALLLYLRYAQRESAIGLTQTARPRRRSRKQIQDRSRSRPSSAWLYASAAACLAALMAKETAVVLPVILFAMAFITPVFNGTPEGPPIQPSLRVRTVSAFRVTLPFLAVTVVYLLLRLNALGGQVSPPTQHLPWRTVLLSWPATLWFYAKVLFWPVRSRGFADPTIADTWSRRDVVLPGRAVCCAAAALVGASVWAWKWTRQSLPDREATEVKRALLLGTLLLVLPILLTLNLNALNPGDFLHGRYTYLSLCGLTLLLATGWHLARRGRIALLSVAALVTVVFSLLTVKQEGAWSDDMTVFTVAHENAPHNVPVARNLTRAKVQVGLALDEQDRCDQAMPIFEEAIQQFPEDWYAWAGSGECLVKLNNLTRAEQSFRQASELSHEPRIIEQWQQVRAMMGLPPAPVK